MRFKVGGALTDQDALVYVQRKSDQESLDVLRAVNYLLVIEPRQQGKTSLVNHLLLHESLSDFNFAYVDLSTTNRASEKTWYETLCPRILKQLKFISDDRRPPIPQDSSQWRDFLSALAFQAQETKHFLAIAFDEIGAVKFSWATSFYAVLREVFNSRQLESEFKYLTFILAGSFHPRDLIADDSISPFNISQRIEVKDFDLQQTRQLVALLNLSSHPDKESTTDIQSIVNRIFYWTDGQPYLVQWLCNYLSQHTSHVSVEDVDTGVDHLRRKDENHLPPMFDRFNIDDILHDYVAKIRGGERVKFTPQKSSHDKQARLSLLGLIKEDEEGYCKIRNKIYELELADFYNQRDSSSVTLQRTSDILAPNAQTQKPAKEERIVIQINQATGVTIADRAKLEQINVTGHFYSDEELSKKIEPHLAEIARLVQLGVDDLRRGQAAIYHEIGQTNRESIAKILDWVQRGQIEQTEMALTLDAIRRAIRAMQVSNLTFNTEVQKAIGDLSSAVESDLGLQQKLELTLPIVPMLLEYKAEWTVGSQLDLHSLQKELKQRWDEMLGRTAK